MSSPAVFLSFLGDASNLLGFPAEVQWKVDTYQVPHQCAELFHEIGLGALLILQLQTYRTCTEKTFSPKLNKTRTSH